MTEQEAFAAMKLFLEQYYERAGNDMETLIADITLESDGQPLDPAAWSDWVKCIQAVTARTPT
jgi:hypothetical protein